jgi:hypothetical protein
MVMDIALCSGSQHSNSDESPSLINYFVLKIYGLLQTSASITRGVADKDVLLKTLLDFFSSLGKYMKLT